MFSKLRPMVRLMANCPKRQFSVSPMAGAATSLSMDSQSRRLVMETEGKPREEYPWIWLRDNCQCPACFEKSSKQRIVNLCEFDLNIKPKNAKEDNNMVKIEWEDGHLGEYEKEWLEKRSFRPEQREVIQKEIDIESHLWAGEMQTEYPTVDFNDIIETDEGLMDWLNKVTKYGFVIVQNAPAAKGAVERFQERIGFGRVTHYGHGYDVEVKPDPSNIAYTTHRIFLHTDLTYYDYQPGVAFLHCIKQHQGEGGETMLADGFYVADLMKRETPDLYKIMTETVANFADIGTDYIPFDKLVQHPFFIHDAKGKLIRVNWSHFGRHSSFNIPIEKVEDTYRAMRQFDDHLNNPKVHIKLKMKPGDIATLHNQRVLHGRTELKGEMTSRHLACGYVDWDEVKSAKRVLQNKKSK